MDDDWTHQRFVPGEHHVWNNVKKPILYLVSGAFAVSAATGAGVYAAAHKTITLDIDGNTTQVTTFKGSVDGLLEENGIVLADGDLVVPSVKSSLEEGGDVVVRYQREVTLDRDGETQKLKTTALDADELLTSLAARGNDGSLVVSRSMGNERVAIDLRLNTDGPVAVLVDGTNEVVDSGTGEIQDILNAQNVELGANDRVSVHTLPRGATSLAQATQEDSEADAQTTPVAADDQIVTLVIERVVTTTESKTQTTKHKTKTVKDSDRYEDLGKKLKTKGVDGKVTTTFEVVTVDGVEESRTQVSEKVDQKAVTEVYVVGTKERPKPVVAKKSTSSSSSGSSSSSDSSEKVTSSVGSDVWGRLAQCESGGNPSIVSRNGLYHGLYQFSVSTWRSVGGSGLPSQASAAEQTKRAKILQARSGWGQWPHCSSKLGLR